MHNGSKARGSECVLLLPGVLSSCREPYPAAWPAFAALSGPRGRRGDQVGGFTLMNVEDLRRVGPGWLKYTEDVRFDPDVSQRASAWKGGGRCEDAATCRCPVELAEAEQHAAHAEDKSTRMHTIRHGPIMCRPGS